MLRSSGLVALGAILAATSTSRADVLVLYGDARGGAMYGTGTSGDDAVKDQAFFARVPNLSYGFSVGARFLFLGGNISHQQYVGPRINDEGVGERPSLATWTQITAGIDFVIGLGDDTQKKARQGGFLHLTAGAGFGVGTGQQVDPPLDNRQIDDKAFLLEGKLGLGKHVGKHTDVGVMVPVSYGYFFKNGVPANMLENHYQGVHVQVLAFLRLNVKLL
jgi:hypothetical protein